MKVIKHTCLYFVSILGLFVVPVSCDPNEVNVPAWQSELLFPIIDARFSIKDVTITDDLLLREDSTGALTIVYVADKDTVSLLDLIEIPDQDMDFELPKFPNDLSDFAFDVALSPADLGLEAPVQNVDIPPFEVPEINEAVDISDNFVEATFESGEIHLSIQNGFPFEINSGLTFELTNTSDGAVFISHTTSSKIPAGGTYEMPIPISLVNKVAEGMMDLSVSDLSSPGGNNLSIEADDTFGMAFTASNLKLLQATLNLPAFQTGEMSQVLDFDLPFGMRLQTLIMRTGEGSITLQEGVELPLLINYTFPSILKNNQAVEGQLDVTSTNPQIINLHGATIDFTDNGAVSDNRLRLNYSLASPGTTQPVTIDFTRTLKANLATANVHPMAVYGHLGYYVNELAGGTDIDFFSAVIEGSIEFSGPKVLAEIENEFGVTVNLIDNEDLYVRAKNQYLYPGEIVDLKAALKNVSVAAAEFPGDREVSTIVMDGASEPSFSDFISLLPREISYSFPIAIGTSAIDYSQFAIDTSKVVGNIQIELPLDLTSKNLTISDTLDFDFELNTEYSELVSGFLNTSVENYFPLEFQLQSYFLDSTYQVIDSLFTERKIISPGSLNDEGRIENPYKVKFSVEFSDEKLNNLKNSRYAKPIFILNTTEQERVKVYSDTNIRFKVNGDFKVFLPNEL